MELPDYAEKNRSQLREIRAGQDFSPSEAVCYFNRLSKLHKRYPGADEEQLKLMAGADVKNAAETYHIEQSRVNALKSEAHARNLLPREWLGKGGK